MGIIDNSIIKINIDGTEFSAKKGSKIIEIADEVGIYIPRFCYHKKLSIAANCRMCLVEVEKAPKLLPACATPVIDGMKIFTNTEKVIDGQRAVMEFLLINHPLDCPICDQGGECELQDLSVGYGCASSRFIEGKRSFEDYDLGPLVATDVTRCILCSRCVRFCAEIAGTEDLGIINRGSNSRIFTFLKKHLTSEVSGNVIDLCPVGALTAKPSRFKFRPWELVQNNFISQHDCVGSNLYVHVFRDKIIRIVPQKNDFINESWISDRDRFSYEGLYSPDRLKNPMIKKNNVWHDVSWKEVLEYVHTKLIDIKNRFGANEIGCIASTNSTLEEFYVLQKFIRTLGSNNIDHRLKQLDFDHQDKMPIFPGINININDIDNMDFIFLIGSDIIKEQPIIGIKLRKIINNGGKVFILNPIDFNFSMNITGKIIINPKEFISVLGNILKNIILKSDSKTITDNLKNILNDISETKNYLNIINAILNSKNKLIMLGSFVTSSPDYSKILSLSLYLSNIINANFGILTDGTNTAGAWLTGFIPHRLPGNNLLQEKGLTISQMFDKNLKSYITFSTEIEYDSLYIKQGYQSLKNADFVLSFSSFKSDLLLDYADVILPIASSYENSGSFINMSGILQSFNAVVPHSYEIKLGWQAIINLANNFKYPGFKYDSIEDILKDIKQQCSLKNKLVWNFIEINDFSSKIKSKLINLPIFLNYNLGSLTRRATALQKTYIKNNNCLKMNVQTYKNLKINNNFIFINNNENKIKYFISIDNTLSDSIITIDDVFIEKTKISPYDEIFFEKS